MLTKILTAISFLVPFVLFSQDIQTVYIKTSTSGNPQMPDLTFDVGKVAYGSYPIFKSSSEHKKRGTRDNVLVKSNTNNGKWNVNRQLNNKFFGGIVSVESENGKVYSKIKIRGLNPKDEDVQRFIKANCKEHWYAYAIARHESRQRFYVFNQFNSTYYNSKTAGTPNCGLPDGWGIMQIDSKRGSQITTSEVYNWQENILSGIAVMDKAKKEAQAYFNAVKRTFPDKWEEPPAYIVISGTKTRLSYLDACVIQLYNGASVVRRLKTAFGTYSYYRSAFEFDENESSGKRWKFKPNVNQYVFKVISHEVEGAIKTQNETQK